MGMQALTGRNLVREQASDTQAHKRVGGGLLHDNVNYERTCTMHIFFPIWPDVIEVLSTAYGAVGCKVRRCLRNMFIQEASHQVRLIYQPAFSALLFSASLLLRHLANLASGHRPREDNLWTEGPLRLVQEGAGKWGKHRRAHRSEI